MEKFKNCKICDGTVDKINATFELVKCQKCKFIFSEKIFSQDEFVNVYDELYNRDSSAYQRHSKNEFDEIKLGNINVGKNRGKLIDKYINKASTKSVLEIGSGVGLVGSYIKKNKPNIRYKGVELDKEAFLKSIELGLETINGDFTAMENIDENFDVIMLWEVLEHLQDLKQFLQLSYQKLNVGGSIILSTPNYDKIKNYSNVDKDVLYQDEPPIHVNYFTKENLKNIMAHLNFKKTVVRVKRFPYLEKNVVRLVRNYGMAIIGKYYGPTIYLEAKKVE